SHISSCFLPEELWDSDYRLFFKKMKKIGYEGFFSYEQCGPVYVNHRMGTIEEVDRRAEIGLQNFRKLLAEV
ncbi:unnamed protein product, partial [marine sediment metagenome]